MSDLGIGARAAQTSQPFRARTIGLMLAIGILGFVGTLVLGAYAPDLSTGRDGGTHALSNAAVGFRGIVQLAAATGRNPIVVRSDHLFASEDLLVVTPGSGFDDLSKLLTARSVRPTLLVLPKWETKRDPAHHGWVRVSALIPGADPANMLAPDTILGIARRRSGGRPLVAADEFDPTIRLAAPRVLQYITGTASRTEEGKQAPKLRALLRDDAGNLILGKFDNRPLYVLADPDLLSNAGIKDAHQAAAALALLDWLNSTGASSIGFDVTTNGLGRSESPLKLAFTPPFLAMTLALAIALILVGWHAFGRFGPVRPRARSIAFGKAALVDNSAKLMRRAGREAKLGGRYAQVMRERAVATFGVPARLRDTALDAYLDQIGGGVRGTGARFSDLAHAAEASNDVGSLIDTARALNEWQKEKTR